VQLDITPEAARILEEVLDRARGEIREEVYKSELADYKAALKQREAIIDSLLHQVRTTAN